MFVEHFNEIKPDIVFILGDRWEMLAPATAASLLKLPIAHHSGGDITQGALDNQIRYALTDLSHLHLVAIQEHADRLIAMGEESERVVTTGEPALSELEEMAQDPSDFFAMTGLSEGQPYVLATFHPTSFDSVSFDDQLDVFTGTLDLIDEKIILTAPNPDPASKTFHDKLKEYASKKENVQIFENLGKKNYYSAMKNATYMVGNSSSGLWEAPSFKLPVLNMGRRQEGRLQAGNVINCPLEIESIKNALEKIKSDDFLKKMAGVSNPYGNEKTNQLILDSLKNMPGTAKVLMDPLKCEN